MSITINISPELEEKLRAKATVAGLAIDRYIERLLQVQVQGTEGQSAPLPKDEAELLEKINLSISPGQWERYYDLVARRNAETLTPAEHKELIRISDAIEEANAVRIRHLVELAQLREISLEELMEELGIKGPSHA